MKKYIPIALCVFLFGCGANQPIAQQTPETKKEEVKVQEQKKEEPQKISVKVTGKGFLPSDVRNGSYIDYLTFTFDISNLTDKDIKGVKGTIVFLSIFGDKIYSMQFMYDEGIKAKSFVSTERGFEYNQFIQAEVLLNTTDFKNLQFDFEPEMIIYEDGTKETF